MFGPGQTIELAKGMQMIYLTEANFTQNTSHVKWVVFRPTIMRGAGLKICGGYPIDPAVFWMPGLFV